MTRRLVVLDASVGVKWLKREAGTERADELLDAHMRGDLTLVVSDMFVFEVLDVARRRYGADDAEAAWEWLSRAGLIVAPTDAALVPHVLAASRSCECSLYDAAAPALAEAFGAMLVSADAKAHASYPGVEVIG